MSRGKSINLFLMDGDANGRIKCTLANWTGVAYKIPRTELDKRILHLPEKISDFSFRGALNSTILLLMHRQSRQRRALLSLPVVLFRQRMTIQSSPA